MASPGRWPRDTYRELLEEITLEEKVAQLGSVNANELLDDTGELDEEAVDEHLSNGIDHLTRIGGEGSLSLSEAAERTNELQTYLREETRLGVPAIPHERRVFQRIHGPEGTTFPQMIGMASTWSPELLETVTGTIRDQLEAIGTTHALSPVYGDLSPSTDELPPAARSRGRDR